MTKAAEEYPVEAMTFHGSWQPEIGENALDTHQEDDASLEFLADMAERIAAACVQSQQPGPRIVDRALPLSRGADWRSDYCLAQPDSCDAPGAKNSVVMLFTSDGNVRPLDEIEADIIRLAVSRYNGRISEVARRLNIGRSTLYRKLDDLGIEYTSYRPQ